MLLTILISVTLSAIVSIFIFRRMFDQIVKYIETKNKEPILEVDENLKSAFEIAQRHGYKGSKEDWIKSLFHPRCVSNHFNHDAYENDSIEREPRES